MICKKCGSECPDGNIFCEACGAELEASVLPDNIDDKGRVKKVKHGKQPKPEKPVKEKKQRTPEQRAAMAKKIKGAGICLLIIAVIIVIVWLSAFLGANKGYSAAQSIPLGRNVEFASSETELVFTDKCANGMINSMSGFDYVCISDDTVKISGAEQPQWAIMLTVDYEDYITDVEYYDFKQIKNNWKGRKMAEILDQESLEFGMSIRNVNKTLGLKPYYVKRSSSNDSVYCYRYYFTDAEAGYDRVFNYYVEFSDVEMTVRKVHYTEINYAETLFNAGEAVEKPPAESSAETSSDEDAEASEADEASEE